MLNYIINLLILKSINKLISLIKNAHYKQLEYLQN